MRQETLVTTVRRFWIGAAFAVAVAAGAFVVWPRTATPANDRDVKTGQAIYAAQCAVCHGESGRGDGPSAAGFATKPADLTNGNLMNPLPDDFLVNIIRNGGPAEGLSPGMPPFKSNQSEEQTRQVVAYVRSLASPAYTPDQTRSIVTVSGAPQQPIFFNHVIHAGSFQIPCQYCHADARRSGFAGLPSVERCMGCHKIIGAQDNPEIKKIQEYWGRKEAIPWVRVFKVPDFTYFPHKPHIRAELACQTCHGPIERMRVVGAHTGRQLGNDLKHLVGLKPPPPPLSMGWCIDCHREQNATRNMRAPLDCVNCHH